MRYPTHEYYEAMKDLTYETGGYRYPIINSSYLVHRHSVTYSSLKQHMKQSVYYNIALIFYYESLDGYMIEDCRHVMKSMCVRYENNPNEGYEWLPSDEWKCTHKRCDDCGKFIRTESTRSQNHHPATICANHEYCSSRTVVCSSCGVRHINPKTGWANCIDTLPEGQYVLEKTLAYKTIWEMTEGHNCEYSGFVLSDNRVYFIASKENGPKISKAPDCGVHKGKLVTVGTDGGVYDDLEIVGSVHSHTSKVDVKKINSKREILAGHIYLSESDTEQLINLNIPYGLILNYGMVFRYYPVLFDNNSVCHFIETFDYEKRD